MASEAGRRTWWDGVRPYVERAPLASLALGVSSAFPLTMITSTLASRLAEAGIEKKSVTAFALVILTYNLKFLWAWIVEGVRLPVIGRLGQRVSWLLVAGLLVIAAVANLALVDPQASLLATAWAAVLVGAAGATFEHVAKLTMYAVDITPDSLGQFMVGLTRASTKLGVDLAVAPFTGIGVVALAEPDLMVEIEAIAVLD